MAPTDSAGDHRHRYLAHRGCARPQSTLVLPPQPPPPWLSFSASSTKIRPRPVCAISSRKYSMMTSLALAALILGSSLQGTVVAVSQKPVIRPSREAPPLAGVKPPAGTRLVNMDIIVMPRSPGQPATYELANPQSAKTFRDQYALNAKQAGYRILISHLVVVGVRTDGTSIRLRVLEDSHGSAGILTVNPPKNLRV